MYLSSCMSTINTVCMQQHKLWTYHCSYVEYPTRAWQRTDLDHLLLRLRLDGLLSKPLEMHSALCHLFENASLWPPCAHSTAILANRGPFKLVAERIWKIFSLYIYTCTCSLTNIVLEQMKISTHLHVPCNKLQVYVHMHTWICDILAYLTKMIVLERALCSWVKESWTFNFSMSCNQHLCRVLKLW